ncbi:hypothetical protein ABZ477_15150 [Microbacterium sp. NPDC019599]|uniref:hypothetical protein n=1 Tax=Microbacterium sp. NPDC019599 TaxID=3154690 RepID=UPI0033D49F97
MTRTVLVIGGTGILAPAVGSLLAAADDVVVVGRMPRPTRAPRATWVDARDAAALSSALAGATWDDAVVYGPAVSDESLRSLRSLTPGRLVLVRTSAAADPALGILVVPRDTLQLGWREDGAEPRWHSPEEVSRAALAVLADGAARTLGTVRPWSDRP